MLINCALNQSKTQKLTYWAGHCIGLANIDTAAGVRILCIALLVIHVNCTLKLESDAKLHLGN